MDTIHDSTTQAYAMKIKNDYRMQVNQVTYAILIGVLTVANMILIWTFAYIAIHYERNGSYLLRRVKTAFGASKKIIIRKARTPAKALQKQRPQY